MKLKRFVEYRVKTCRKENFINQNVSRSIIVDIPYESGDWIQPYFQFKVKGSKKQNQWIVWKAEILEQLPHLTFQNQILAVTNETHVFLSEKIHPILAR